MTCLVADASATTRRSCRRTLEGLGCAVLEAASRAEADVHAAEELQLVIVGRQLTDADALEFVRALRGAERTATVPVLMISDVGQRATVVTATEAGVTSYLLRPFEMPFLTGRIQALLRSRTPGTDKTAPDDAAPEARAA